MNAEERQAPSPSGHQYAIAHGSSRAHISTVGATLRAYSVDGRDVVDGFPAAERATDGRGQVLAPWPNRLTDGSYRYGDRDCQAPLNEVSRHDAIHGFVRWLDWSPVAHDPASVALSCAVRPQPGYEWHLELGIEYRLGPAGLTVSFRATNVGGERAPFGLGFHPYLTTGTDSIDGLELTLPATTYLGPDGAARPVASAAQDFTIARRIASTRLDTAYADLVRGDDGRALARLEDPADGRFVELWVDDGFRYLMVYTADQVGDLERRRQAVAVEPMTCPPDAFRTGTDLVELDPGQSWQGSWGLRTGVGA
ncbi:MAG: aldose 1-epimerase family protein [Nocardioides sp.]